MFLSANRRPPSGQARGHASPEHALRRSKKFCAAPIHLMSTTNDALSPVAVVGAGALGCLFGGMLARAGTSVTLVGRAGHVAAIRQDGLRFESRGQTTTIPVTATED